MDSRKVKEQEFLILEMLLDSGHKSFHLSPELASSLCLDPGYPFSSGDEIILDVVHAINLTAFQDLVEEVPELLGSEDSVPVDHADEDG
jgi:hypothetical protein